MLVWRVDWGAGVGDAAEGVSGGLTQGKVWVNYWLGLRWWRGADSAIDVVLLT